MNNKNLLKRRGVLIIERNLFLNFDLYELKIIFSNFYPISIENFFGNNFFNGIKYIGFSEHFEEVEEGCVIPEYTVYLKSVGEGIIEFEKMIKKECLI